MKKCVLLLALVTSQTLAAQNIGLGTSTPQAKLHIFSPVNELLRLDGAFPVITFYSDNTYSGYLGMRSYGVEIGSVAGTFLPIVFAPDGIPRMYIRHNGLVGIGTDLPEASLDVARGIAGSVTANFRGTSHISHFNFGTDEHTYIRAGKDNGNLILNDIIGGKVGIGLNVPSAKLSISSDGTELAGTAASNTLRTNAGTLGNSPGDELSLANFGFLSGNNSSFGIKASRNTAGSDWTSTSLLLGYDVDNINRAGGGYITLSATGNIGIGVANPGYPLDLNNRMRIRSGGNNNVSAGLWLNNNANTEAAFIGMEDDTHVGLFGNNGAGWRFSMNTQTGALKINGTEGIPGQVLKSNAAGASASWDFPVKTYQWILPNYDITTTETSAFSQNLVATTNCTYIISIQMTLIGGPNGGGEANLSINGIKSTSIQIKIDGNYATTSIISLPNFIFNAVPGTHTLDLRMFKYSLSGNMSLWNATGSSVRSYISVVQVAR